jgi:hypothetical protein
MMKYRREAEEAIRLGEYAIYDEAMIGVKIAEIFGCKPLSEDRYNFSVFLSTIYHYGKIQGIRQERIKKRKIS